MKKPFRVMLILTILLSGTAGVVMAQRASTLHKQLAASAFPTRQPGCSIVSALFFGGPDFSGSCWKGAYGSYTGDSGERYSGDCQASDMCEWVQCALPPVDRYADQCYDVPSCDTLPL